MAGISPIAQTIGAINIQTQTLQLQNSIKLKSNDTTPATSTVFQETVGKHYTAIAIKEYSSSIGNVGTNISTKGQYAAQSNLTTTTKNNIVLPIPIQLEDTNAVTWNAESLNIAGDIAGMVGRGINDILGASVFGSGLLSNVSGAIQATAGYAPNEFLTMLFKGPTYKKFNLSWKVSPKNKQQTDDINNIILQMKNAQAPALDGAGFAFKYPKVFYVKLMNNGSENKYLYKFKPAVLETFSVNYAGSGIPGFFKGSGAPESIIMTASFIELEFWLSGDFN